MADRYDAIVIGAGPAGSTAARELAGEGLAVLLLERRRLPRDKPCGGGLTPRAWRQLPVPIDDLVLNRATSVQLRAGPSVTARLRSRGAAIWMVRRRDLDLRLAEEAVRRGAELHDAEEVLGLEGGEGAWVVTDLGRYRARVVIGADGAESRVARWAGLSRPHRRMVALDAEVRVAGDPLAGEAVVDLSVPRGYAWIFPKGDLYNVGVGSFDPRVAPELRRRLDRFLAEAGLPAPDPLAVKGHRIPAGLPPGPLHRGNVLLAGDAAGVADPLFAEGIPYALLTGRLAAETALDYLAGRSPDLASYTRRVRAVLLPDMRVWRATAAFVHRFPAASLRILAASGALQSRLERTLAGDVTFGGL